MMRIEYSYGRNISLAASSAGSAGGCVVAIGFFDGVHKAHRALIGAARKRADELSIPLAVLTFAADGGIKPGAKKIYSDDEKAELLFSAGADVVVNCDFSSVRDLEGGAFCDDVLCRDLAARAVFCGFNFRFGKGASSGVKELGELLSRRGAELVVMDDYHLGGKTLSSTVIRGLLSEGRVAEAAEALGEPYFIDCGIIHGNGVGKGLGIPTVNGDTPEDKILLGRGVYLTEAVIGDAVYPALTNVGTCPTFSERAVHTETFILGFNGDLYGKRLRIKFLEFLREEKTFDSEKELVIQINIDKNKALSLYGDLKWQDSGHN